MQRENIIGAGAALLTLSLGSVTYAQTAPGAPYQPPPIQPAAAQPAYPSQPGQPVYVYPPGNQPPPGYYQPGAPPPRQIVGSKTRPRIGLIIGGSIMLGTMWVISSVAGGVSQTICEASSSFGCANTYWPLFIPVVGPFIQMGYIPHDSTRSLALLGLAFDGLVQVGGLTMLIVGAAVRQRVPVYAQRWQLSPMLSSSGTGLAFSARF